jgi:hypothetical protein
MRARLLVVGALLVVFHSADARADEAGLAEIFGELGFSTDQTNELIASTEPFSMVPYRFADDPTGLATISPTDSPWTQPLAIGSELIVFPEGGRTPSFPTDALVVNSGAGLVPGRPYAFFWATYAAEMPVSDFGELTVNISAPILVPGGEPWVPLPQYPADTWGAGSIFPYLDGPNPWTFAMSATSDGSLTTVAFDGVAFIGSGVSGFAVDANALLGVGGDWNTLTFGYAFHVHDGRFGICATCPSTISAVPAIGPGGSLNRTFLPVSSVTAPLVVGGEPRVAPTTIAPTTVSPTSTVSPTTASPSTTVPATTISVTTTVATAALTPTPTSPETVPPVTNSNGQSTSDQPSEFPWLLIGIGGVVVLGTGVAVAIARSRSDSNRSVVADVPTAPAQISWPDVIATEHIDDAVPNFPIVAIAKDTPRPAEDPPKVGLRGWRP